MTTQTSDNLTAIACQKKDLSQFSFLYEKYVKKIYNFIYYRTFHKETAEDLTSKVFIKALENINKFNPQKGKFSSWLYQVARNIVIDYYRSQKQELNFEEFWGIASNQNLSASLDQKQAIEEIKTYLQKLDSLQRDIVIMRLWDELSYKEISQIIGKSEAACKMCFSRVMQSMRKELSVYAIVILFVLSIIKNHVLPN